MLKNFAKAARDETLIPAHSFEKAAAKESELREAFFGRISKAAAVFVDEQFKTGYNTFPDLGVREDAENAIRTIRDAVYNNNHRAVQTIIDGKEFRAVMKELEKIKSREIGSYHQDFAKVLFIRLTAMSVAAKDWTTVARRPTSPTRDQIKGGNYSETPDAGLTS